MTSLTETWQAGRTARAARPARRLPNLRRARTFLLQVTGFGFIDYAVWGWHHLVGYAAVGVSLLVLEALGGDKR